MTILDFVPTDQTAKLAILTYLDLILGTLRLPHKTQRGYGDRHAAANRALRQSTISILKLPMNHCALRTAIYSLHRSCSQKGIRCESRSLVGSDHRLRYERSALADALAATPTGIGDLPADCGRVGSPPTAAIASGLPAVMRAK